MEIHIYLVNIHSPKWGWIAVDTSVYQAMKQQLKANIHHFNQHSSELLL